MLRWISIRFTLSDHNIANRDVLCDPIVIMLKASTDFCTAYQGNWQLATTVGYFWPTATPAIAA